MSQLQMQHRGVLKGVVTCDPVDPAAAVTGYDHQVAPESCGHTEMISERRGSRRVRSERREGLYSAARRAIK